MSKPIIKIHNTATDEVIEREMTEEEHEHYKKSIAEGERQKQERENKINARESALAKLAALGLTEEEIAAL